MNATTIEISTQKIEIQGGIQGCFIFNVEVLIMRKNDYATLLVATFILFSSFALLFLVLYFSNNQIIGT